MYVDPILLFSLTLLSLTITVGTAQGGSTIAVKITNKEAVIQAVIVGHRDCLLYVLNL